MERTLYQKVVYNIGYFLLLCWFRIYTRIRYYNWRKVPQTGPVVIIANHQSFFDPPAIGTSLWRPLHYMARSTLFKGLLGHFLWAVGGYPVEQDGGSAIGAIKETLRLLKKGEAVLMFPEGTRTPNGHMQPFFGGIIMIAKKAKVPIIPCSVNGAYKAYPRHAKFPRPYKVTLTFGDLIPVEEIQKLTNEELLKLLEEKVAEHLWDDAKPEPVVQAEVEPTQAESEPAQAEAEPMQTELGAGQTTTEAGQAEAGATQTEAEPTQTDAGAGQTTATSESTATATELATAPEPATASGSATAMESATATESTPTTESIAAEDPRTTPAADTKTEAP